MKRSLFLFSALLVAGAASAQDAFDAHVADVGLLQAKQIQDDVKITAAQRARMNKAADAHKARLQDYEKQMKALGMVQPDRKRIQSFLETLKKEVFAILSPPQLSRLRQLTLQRVGLISLTDNDVAKRVGLSPSQVGSLKSAFKKGRTQFVGIQEATRNPILAPYKGRKPKNEAEAAALRKEIQSKLLAASAKIKPRLVAIGKQTDVAMMAILNPTQKAKWAALKGVPFKAK